MKLKTYIKNTRAVTLTELIISSVLVGIIMIGIVSFNFAMKRIEESSSKNSILSVQAATFLAMIKKDAQKAIGDVTNSGVRTFESGNDRCICFRHDEDNDPNNYNGDVWKCYFKRNANLISRKTFGDTEGNGDIPNNAASCRSPNGGAQIMSNLIGVTSDTFYNVPGGCGACNGAGDENRMQHIEIIFEAIRDPGEAAHPLNNPTMEIQTKINPVAHGRR